MKAAAMAEQIRSDSIGKMLCTLWVIIALFALLTLSAPSRAYGSDEQEVKAPSVEIAEIKYDFGFAVDGQEIVHDFVLKNTGTAPLEIQKVQTA